MVPHLVIHSDTCSSSRHLFISSASLSWMGVNFLNHHPCIPSRPGVFQFDIFSVILTKSMLCVFPLSVLLRVLLTLSPFCLSIWLFVMFSLLLYFTLELFSFFCIRLLVYSCVISANLLVELSLVVLEHYFHYFWLVGWLVGWLVIK